MTTEREFNKQFEVQLLRKRALEYLDTVGCFIRPHTVNCDAEDLSGHPAPCTCGADKANELPRFIRNSVLKGI